MKTTKKSSRIPSAPRPPLATHHLILGPQPELVDLLCEYLVAHEFEYDGDFAALYAGEWQIVGVEFFGPRAGDANASAWHWLVRRASIISFIVTGESFGISDAMWEARS